MLKEIDIGHAGQSARDAISDLEVAVSTAKTNPKITAVKIIHGLGSGRIGVQLFCSGALLELSNVGSSSQRR